MTRDFSTISPSARWLLLAKAHSGLPYAREAAELLFGADAVAAAAVPESPAAAVRRRHFALRARSVDEALDAVGATRILELAAGLSLRGLARASQPDVHYIDTDLPDLVALKRDLVARLAAPVLSGSYRIESLDVLDAAAFARTVATLPPGPLAIAHEGLLMYLDPSEKAQLAANIRAALLARGGAWITADVYLRKPTTVPREQHVEKFLAEHRVEENKFASFDEAESFFRDAGFTITQRLVPSDDPALVRQTWILSAR